ncbi:hypothetical protein EDB80DRAFT_6171 [Ilyonectria destructans]|nr:hypothetical protein EDB80DRAFT_6171 [Ilyonectria destructans]
MTHSRWGRPQLLGCCVGSFQQSAADARTIGPRIPQRSKSTTQRRSQLRKPQMQRVPREPITGPALELMPHAHRTACSQKPHRNRFPTDAGSRLATQTGKYRGLLASSGGRLGPLGASRGRLGPLGVAIMRARPLEPRWGLGMLAPHHTRPGSGSGPAAFKSRSLLHPSWRLHRRRAHTGLAASPTSGVMPMGLVVEWNTGCGANHPVRRGRNSRAPM